MHVLRKALAEFLHEDIGKGDITSSILPNIRTTGEIICKERAVVAGLVETRLLFQLVNCRTKILVREGQVAKPGSIIMVVTGKARSMLSAERTALNILMRMSGIATETRRYVDEVKKINRHVKIACTRKTSPGFRIFDKRAVRVGGGETHRMRLDEKILIKDNHLAIANSITDALRRARKRYPRGKVEIEVRNLKEAIEAIESGANIIMLDNLSPTGAKSVLRALQKMGLRKKVSIEVSGGVTHDNVKRYASADVDTISIGSLTHSPKAIDMSLEITKVV